MSYKLNISFHMFIVVFKVEWVLGWYLNFITGMWLSGDIWKGVYMRWETRVVLGETTQTLNSSDCRSITHLSLVDHISV